MSAELGGPSPEDRVRVSADRPLAPAPGAPRPGLGVGAIVGGSFAIFFRRLPVFILLALVPLVVVQVVVASVFGGLFMTSLFEGFDPAAGTIPGRIYVLWGLVVVLGNALVLLILGFMVQAAYDTRLGRPVRLGLYFGGALRQVVPLLICSLVAILLIYLASIFMLVPGLWVMAVFSVTVPIVVIERAGFGALGRSAALTRGYRWPIAGALILLILGAMVVSIVLAVLTAVGGMAASAVLTAAPGLGAGLLATILGTVWYSVQLAAGLGILCVGIALIYARLREIKEGTGVEALAEVFA